MWETLQTYSGAVVGIFTVVLVGVTVVYVFVTYRLLKQSKNALLADITLRVMESCWKQIKEMRVGEEKKAAALAGTWMEGYCAAFIKIDKRLGVDILNVIKAGLNASLKEWLKEGKEQKRKFDEKVKKLDRKLKEIKDLEKKLKEKENP